MGRISFITRDGDRSGLAGVKRGPWSPDEDQKLVAYIRRYGIWNWTHMPKAAPAAREDDRGILESLPEELMSDSSTSSGQAPGFEETSKESTPIEWTDNNGAMDLELDRWENAALHPLELEDAYPEWDMGSICAASYGFELPQCHSPQPESSTEGYLFYDNLWQF
ncbi:hypothetical protein SAY86_011524 [Trapa natans]|uniref:Myb-like domain-containing protein n=1 Tax=Trapa natans TaxID=22666 RepID=A0AAN7LKE1_TRANT|nr:hypothetical protein SAY86_011524 [Trapa natans]